MGVKIATKLAKRQQVQQKSNRHQKSQNIEKQVFDVDGVLNVALLRCCGKIHILLKKTSPHEKMTIYLIL